MQINISSTAEVKSADIIDFRSATAPDKSEYIAAIHAFCDSMQNPMPPKEFGGLDKLARLDIQRKTIVVQMSRYYKLHRTADVAPGVFAIITLLTDNDTGVCTLSEPALAELFGRSENAVHEARKRLKTDRMIETTRGRYAGSHPVIPRAIADSYNHLVWTVEAMREFNPPATQGDCQSPRLTGGLAQSPRQAGGLKAVNPPVEGGSIPLPHRGQLLTSFLTDNKCPPNNSALDENSSDRLRAAAVALAAGLAAATPLPAAADLFAPPPQALHGVVETGIAQAPPAKPKLGYSRLPEDWFLPKSWGQWAMHNCKRDEDWVRTQAEKFKEYWISVPDNKGFKKSWERTWQNWCGNALKREAKYNNGEPFGRKNSYNSTSNYSYSGNYTGRTI